MSLGTFVSVTLKGSGFGRAQRHQPPLALGGVHRSHVEVLLAGDDQLQARGVRRVNWNRNQTWAANELIEAVCDRSDGGLTFDVTHGHLDGSFASFVHVVLAVVVRDDAAL